MDPFGYPFLASRRGILQKNGIQVQTDQVGPFHMRLAWQTRLYAVSARVIRYREFTVTTLDVMEATR